MKKGIFSIIIVAQILCLTSLGMAIDTVPKDIEDETLFRTKPRVGAFLSPTIKFSEINDQAAVLIGGSAGFILNRNFVIGGAGYGLVNEVEGNMPERRLLQFGYGGLLLGYINRSRKLVHLSLHSLIGGGGLCWRTRYYNDWYDALFVIEPGVDVMVNVTKSFRIGLGGSYRFVYGEDYARLVAGVGNEEIRGPALSLTFKFGRF